MKNRTSEMVEGGVMIALATVLSMIKVYQLPNGGSITAASMVPIIFYALRHGAEKGYFVAFVYTAVQFIVDGAKFVYPLSILLDYLLGFGLLGTAGFFKGSCNKAVLGASISGFLRFLAVFLSGWIVFGSYAPEGMNPALYSLLYNASYMIPEIIITIIATKLMYKKIIDI